MFLFFCRMLLLSRKLKRTEIFDFLFVLNVKRLVFDCRLFGYTREIIKQY